MALGSVWARLKAIGGGTERQLPTIASATALVLNETSNVFVVTGTTTIGSIDTATTPIRPGRVIVLLFAGTISVTDTAVASTANGKIHTGSTSPALGTTLTLMQANNGSWWQIGYSANG